MHILPWRTDTDHKSTSFPVLKPQPSLPLVALFKLQFEFLDQYNMWLPLSKKLNQSDMSKIIQRAAQEQE